MKARANQVNRQKFVRAAMAAVAAGSGIACSKVKSPWGCTSAKGRFRKEGGIFCVACRIIYGRRIKAWTISPRQFLLASHN